MTRSEALPSPLPDADEPSQRARVSVVIPVYNGEDHLPAQLEALAQQTYTGDWEVVVADNGSVDATPAIIERFAETMPQMRAVDASGRRGPSYARNVGVGAAHGDLLLFCDADDVVAPDWVEAFVAASCSGELLAGVGVVSRDPEADNTESDDPTPPPSNFRFLPWGRSSNLALQRVAFDKIGGFDEDRLRGEDADLCWRVQLAGFGFRFVPEAFVAYRDWGTPREVWARQFSFGRASPRLYADYAGEGAPRERPRRLALDLLWLLWRTPRWLVTEAGRLRWWAQLAGLAGRVVGLVELRSRTRRL